MKKFILFVFLLFIIIKLFGQYPVLSLWDGVWGESFKYKVQDFEQINWIDSNRFYYVGQDTLKIINFPAEKVLEFLTLSDFNKCLTQQNLAEISCWPEIKWHNKNEFYCLLKNHFLIYQTGSGSIIKNLEIDKDADNIEIDPIHFSIAYTINKKLFISDSSGNVTDLTRYFAPDSNVTFGQVVYRNEFGTDHGAIWSPSGTCLAFYSNDESMVTDYPLVDINQRVATLKNVKYPMAGMSSQLVKLHLYNTAEKTVTTIQSDPQLDEYLTNISWGRDERYVFVAVLNRDQNHLRYNQYDISSGGFVKTLFEEKNEKYVEPLYPAVFLKIHPGEFIWQSRRDGYNHIYLYNTEGKLIRQLTKGEWEVTEIIGFDKTEDNLFLTGTKESPIERQVYKVSLSTGQLIKISREEGTHQVFLNPENHLMIDRYSNYNIPNRVKIINEFNANEPALLNSPDPFNGAMPAKLSVGKIKSEDNIDLYYRLILPPDLDSSRKYPVIVYVYGGPHVQLISDQWLGGADLWLYYMAQQGFIIFTIDSKGSANRGFDFESATFRHLGEEEMKDQVSGIQFISTLPFADTSKIGVYGWSFGGYMAISLMLHYPAIYKVGVAGGPVIDWKFYEVMYTERYMDAPETNKEGYEKSNLNNYTDNLTGKLLIIHGAMDDVVLWQHSLSFLNSCIASGKQVDYFVYPNHKHHVGGNDYYNLMEKITIYFMEHL